MPSPLKSPTATEKGPLIAVFRAAWKEPSPLPKSTLTLPSRKFGVTRSGTPSALKSPTTTERGPAPVGELTVGAKPALRRLRSSSDSRDNRLPAGRERDLTDGLVVRRLPLPRSHCHT